MVVDGGDDDARVAAMGLELVPPTRTRRIVVNLLGGDHDAVRGVSIDVYKYRCSSYMLAVILVDEAERSLWDRDGDDAELAGLEDIDGCEANKPLHLGGDGTVLLGGVEEHTGSSSDGGMQVTNADVENVVCILLLHIKLCHLEYRIADSMSKVPLNVVVIEGVGAVFTEVLDGAVIWSGGVCNGKAANWVKYPTDDVANSKASHGAWEVRIDDGLDTGGNIL